jgi:hypothetical protein
VSAILAAGTSDKQQPRSIASDSSCIKTSPHELNFGLRGNPAIQTLTINCPNSWKATSQTPWILINESSAVSGSGNATIAVSLKDSVIPKGKPWGSCGTVVSAYIDFVDISCRGEKTWKVEVFFYSCPCC